MDLAFGFTAIWFDRVFASHQYSYELPAYYPNTLAAPALSVPTTLADRMLVNYDSTELGKAIIIGVGQVCFFSDLTSG